MMIVPCFSLQPIVHGPIHMFLAFVCVENVRKVSNSAIVIFNNVPRTPWTQNGHHHSCFFAAEHHSLLAKMRKLLSVTLFRQLALSSWDARGEFSLAQTILWVQKLIKSTWQASSFCAIVSSHLWMCWKLIWKLCVKSHLNWNSQERERERGREGTENCEKELHLLH